MDVQLAAYFLNPLTYSFHIGEEDLFLRVSVFLIFVYGLRVARLRCSVQGSLYHLLGVSILSEYLLQVLEFLGLVFRADVVGSVLQAQHRAVDDSWVVVGGEVNVPIRVSRFPVHFGDRCGTISLHCRV